jgi:hypothetical protein
MSAKCPRVQCKLNSKHSKPSQRQRSRLKPNQTNQSPQSAAGSLEPAGSRIAKRFLKGLSREAIAEAMEAMDVGGVILSLLKSKRERTELETLVFVWGRLYGRPAQNMNVSGSMVVSVKTRSPRTKRDKMGKILLNFEIIPTGPISAWTLENLDGELRFVRLERRPTNCKRAPVRNSGSESEMTQGHLNPRFSEVSLSSRDI